MVIYTVDEYINKGVTAPSQWLVARKGSDRVFYYPDFLTFDTEFTSISQGKKDAVGLLYLWQCCAFGDVIMGRTLDEWARLVGYFRDGLGLYNCKRIICYVHNLEADFQYLQAYFKKWDLLPLAKRAVLSAYSDGIEYRCSYKLTNMSLRKFLENEGVPTQKGDMDYRKLRTPTTALTDEELNYAYNDVRGLYEAIHALMDKTGDDLVTIPVTSTGYVRRDCRNAMRKNKRNRDVFQKMALNADQYELFREAFRGGNTHANRYHAGKLCQGLQSFDIASSYPAVLLYNKYPMGRCVERDEATMADLAELERDGYGYIIKCRIRNLRTTAPVPYVPVAKCKFDSIDHVIGGYIINDNGRVLYAGGWTEMTLLDVDLRIIIRTYNYDDIIIDKCYYYKMAYIPLELQGVISDYFCQKTTLKGIKGQEYYYTKAKNKLNSIYGMMVMAPIRPDIRLNSGDWTVKECEDVEGALEGFYKSRNNFLSYQWGVYVTAYARERLQEAIDICGMHLVYCDTDSVKYIRDDKITRQILAINDKIREKALNCAVTARAFTKKGQEQILGVWDEEDSYKMFVSLGAKKYADVIEEDGEEVLQITVSGLAKSAAAEIGDITNFTPGLTVYNSGRTISHYDDNIMPHVLTIDGEDYEIRSNLAITDTTYTLGITEEYEALIFNRKYSKEKTVNGEKIICKSSASYDPD